MLRELLAQKQNYALILLLFALLAYSLIGFSLDVSADESVGQPREGTEQHVARSSHQTAPIVPTVRSVSQIAFSRH